MPCSLQLGGASMNRAGRGSLLVDATTDGADDGTGNAAEADAAVVAGGETGEGAGGHAARRNNNGRGRNMGCNLSPTRDRHQRES